MGPSTIPARRGPWGSRGSGGAEDRGGAQPEDAADTSDWTSRWVILRVKLGHVQRLGAGEATLRLLFSTGGNPLEDHVARLRAAVEKLELDHSAELHAEGWDTPLTSALRANPSFVATFQLARSALLKGFERSAARYVGLVALIDETLLRRGLKKHGHQLQRPSKQPREAPPILIPRTGSTAERWKDFSLESNKPAQNWINGVDKLFQGAGTVTEDRLMRDYD